MKIFVAGDIKLDTDAGDMRVKEIETFLNDMLSGPDKPPIEIQLQNGTFVLKKESKLDEEKRAGIRKALFDAFLNRR